MLNHIPFFHDRRSIVLAAAFAVGAAAGYQFVHLVRGFYALTSFSYSHWVIILVQAFPYFVGILFGLVTYLLVRRECNASGLLTRFRRPPRSRVFRALRTALGVLLGLAWLATATIGVPVALSDRVAQDIVAFKDVAAYQRLPISAPYPRIDAQVAIPVLPGVILLFQGAQFAGQAGGGGWYLYAWWVTGLAELRHWILWVS